MVLRDIVEGHNYLTIMVRCNYPRSMQHLFTSKELADGMLFGYCAYVDGKLHSLDGDSYSLDEEIEHYTIFPDMLVVWVHAEYYNDECL